MEMPQEQQQEQMNPSSLPSLSFSFQPVNQNKRTLEVKPVVGPPALALRRPSQGGAEDFQSSE